MDDGGGWLVGCWVGRIGRGQVFGLADGKRQMRRENVDRQFTSRSLSATRPKVAAV